MCCKMTMIRRQLKESRLLQLKEFRRLRKELGAQWPKLQSSKRIVIHIPSLGFSPAVREAVDKIAPLQNSQIARLCDIRDPNVDVIYVSAVEISDDMTHYYRRLVAVMADATGQNCEEVMKRLKIITPDCIHKFPAHNLCLSTLLKYSPQTLRRLKSLVAGSEAYIVPGLMHVDDLYISSELGVPVLGSEPDIAQMYSTKSGVRRIFEGAQVAFPPGECDIYNLQKLKESLARLVTENLLCKRWLFKVNNQFDGRGTAFCDVATRLSCYDHALREAERYGNKWSQRWANEPTYLLVLKEIGAILLTSSTVVDECLYPSFELFLQDFLRHGGLIEACPPADSVTALTVNMLIDPTGDVQLLSVSDQIHSTSPYQCWGHSLPQSSCEPATVNQAAFAIARACKDRGVLGYFSIDFVTFIDPVTMNQMLWAVDLDLQYSSSLSMMHLLLFLTDGKLDPIGNVFQVERLKSASVNPCYQSKRKKLPRETSTLELTERFSVFSTNLFHTNLNTVNYNVFFQMCKSRGIGYDSKMKLGSAFTLVEHVRKESVGMLVVGESLYSSLHAFMSNLMAIHNGISAPSMQGTTNFKGAISDISKIIQEADINANLPSTTSGKVQETGSQKDGRTCTEKEVENPCGSDLRQLTADS